MTRLSRPLPLTLLFLAGHLAASASSVVLSLPSGSAVFGQPVTLTSLITPATATGSVTFYDGTTILGTSPVSSGGASFTTGLLASGPRLLRASYSGDAGNAAAVSSAAALIVTTVPGYGFLPGTTLNTGNPYRYFSVSAATGDFNGDGKIDFAVANSTASSVGIFSGNGDGTFQNAVNYPTGSHPSSVAVGDFNGDGKPDLAITNLSGNNVSILPGNGDGTFQAPVNYATGASPIFVAVGDFNGDGKADLVVVNVGSNSIRILPGAGDGTFQAASNISVGTIPETAVVGDFNGDGIADLALTNSGIAIPPGAGGSIGILLGNGDGTFQAPVIYTEPSGNPGAITVGDLNGDGKADLAVTQAFDSTVDLYMGNGDGTFQAPLTLQAGINGMASTTGITICDTNGDGVADLAITTESNGVGQLNLYLGTGGGSFQYYSRYGTEISQTGSNIAYVDSVVAADFNGDGRTDFVFTLEGQAEVLLGSKPLLPISLESSVSPVTNGQNVTLTATVSDPTVAGTITFGENGTSVGSATLASGQAVLAGISVSPGTYRFYAGFAGNAAYAATYSASVIQVINAIPVASSLVAAANYPVGNYYPPLSIAQGDFNGDGITDFAVAFGSYAIAGGKQIGVLMGNNDGSFQPVRWFAAGNNPNSVAVSDFNRDGYQDLVVANAGAGVNILLGNGDGTFQAQVGYSAGSIGNQSAFNVVVDDFDGDGKMDLAVANNSGDGVSVLLGKGDGTFQAAQFFPADTTATYLAVGDFNSDGFKDLAVANSGNADVSILLGNGNGTFQSPVNYPVGTNPYSIAVADFNGDRNADLVVANTESNNVTVLLGDGKGQFSTAATYPVGNFPASVALSDLDGDGMADLIVANGGDTNLSVLTSNGDGTFTTRASIPDTFGGPVFVLAGHFFPDKGTDIVVANQSTDNILMLTGFSLQLTPQAITFGPLGNLPLGTAPFTLSASASSGLTVAFISNSPSVCTVSGATVTILISGGCSITATQFGNVTYEAAPPVTQSFTVLFSDLAPTDMFYDEINAFAQYGITAGCGNNNFCPDANVTRDEMAIFIVRAVYGGDNFTYTASPYFTDVQPTTFGFKWIQKLKDLGITAGCTATTYCPTEVVTRDQMAVFIVRARLGTSIAGSPPTFTYPSAPYFTDATATNQYFPWIQRMKLDNITGGCTATTYCSSDPVTRGEMATFIMRGAFNQFLPAGTPVLTQISPSTLASGTSGTFTITGSNTNFVQGTTQLSPIPGATIGTITVASPVTMTVQLTAATNAVAQPYSVLAITGAEQDVLPNGLVIQ